jgi:hypothetical protein
LKWGAASGVRFCSAQSAILRRLFAPLPMNVASSVHNQDWLSLRIQRVKFAVQNPSAELEETNIAPLLAVHEKELSAPLKLKLKFIYDRQPVGQSVLVSGAHLGPATNFFSPSNFF